MVRKKILLIDRNVEFLDSTSQIFTANGAEVITAGDGLDGISKLFTHRPDLIILDIMTPEKEGLQICQQIRQISSTPLIMLSTLDNEHLILEGLAAGADDFLSKPCSPEILLARAKAVIRRSEQSDEHQAVLEYNDGYLQIDVEKHRVLLNNKLVKLTPVEFRLLVYLVSHAGRVLTFEQILHNVWGSEYRGNDDYVHVYISHLRGKIEQDTKSPRYILTIHGIGYIFEKRDITKESLNKHG